MKEKFIYVTKSLSLVGLTNLLSCLYLLAWTLIPIFRKNTNDGFFRYLFVVIVLLWFVTSILINKKWVNRLVLPAMLGIFTILVMGIYIYFGYGDMTPSRLVGPLFIILFILMGYYYTKSKDLIILEILLFFTGIFATLTAITTLGALSNNPNVSRLMTSSVTSPEILLELSKLNVAGYDFIYGIVILIPILLILPSAFNKNKKSSFLIYLMIGILLILIGLANFTTAYLLSLVALVLHIINSNKKTRLIKIALLSIGVLFAKNLKIIIVDFLLLIREYTPGLRSKANLLGIVNIINGQTSLDSVTSRGILLQNSINSFKEKPILGVGGIYKDNTIIGLHSQFVDDFARFGLVGYTPFLVFNILVMRFIIKSIKSAKVRSSFVSSTIVYVILGFLNPTHSYNISFSYFFVLPILSKYLDTKLS